MIHLIARKFKEQRNSLLVYIGSLIGYTLLMMSMFPSLKNAGMEELIKSYPEQLGKFFGESGMSTFSTIEGFLSMEFLSLFFVLIIAFYLGSAAGSAIAGQIEKRTMDFNLSQPISRTKMLLSEAYVALFNLLISTLAVALSIYLFARIFDITIKIDGLSAFSITATLFLWALYGIALTFSALMRSRIGVMLLIVGFTLGSYVFLSLTRLVDKLKDLDNLSIFTLYNPEKLLGSGEIEPTHLAILGSITIVGIITAMIIFNKKDV